MRQPSPVVAWRRSRSTTTRSGRAIASLRLRSSPNALFSSCRPWSRKEGAIRSTRNSRAWQIPRILGLGELGVVAGRFLFHRLHRFDQPVEALIENRSRYRQRRHQLDRALVVAPAVEVTPERLVHARL